MNLKEIEEVYMGEEREKTIIITSKFLFLQNGLFEEVGAQDCVDRKGGGLGYLSLGSELFKHFLFVRSLLDHRQLSVRGLGTVRTQYQKSLESTG